MATVSVKIPTPLRKFTNGQDIVSGTGETVLDVVNDVETRSPGLKTKLVDDDNRLRRFINIYAGEEDVRFLQGLATPLKDGDVLSVIPAIAGG